MINLNTINENNAIATLNNSNHNASLLSTIEKTNMNIYDIRNEIEYLIATDNDSEVHYLAMCIDEYMCHCVNEGYEMRMWNSLVQQCRVYLHEYDKEMLESMPIIEPHLELEDYGTF